MSLIVYMSFDWKH